MCAFLIGSKMMTSWWVLSVARTHLVGRVAATSQLAARTRARSTPRRRSGPGRNSPEAATHPPNAPSALGLQLAALHIDSLSPLAAPAVRLSFDHAAQSSVSFFSTMNEVRKSGESDRARSLPFLVAMRFSLSTW